MGDWERDGRRAEGKSNNLQPKSRKGGRLSKAAALKGRGGEISFMISSSSLPRPFPFPFEEGGRAQEEFEDRRVRSGQSSLRKTVTNQPFSASPFSKCESEVLAGATFLGVERSASTTHRKAPLQFLLPFPSWSFALFPIPAHCPAKLPLPFPFLLPPKKGVFLPFRVSKKS